MSGKTNRCEIGGCENEAQPMGLCKTCYAGMYYWKGATPSRILERRKQLDRLQNRMELMTPNVRTLHSGTRKKQRKAR